MYDAKEVVLELERMVGAVEKNLILVYDDGVDGSPMDADHIAVWLGRTLHSAGIKIRFVAAKRRGDQYFQEVFIEAFYPVADRWVRIDPLGSDEYNQERFNKGAFVKSRELPPKPRL